MSPKSQCYHYDIISHIESTVTHVLHKTGYKFSITLLKSYALYFFRRKSYTDIFDIYLSTYFLFFLVMIKCWVDAILCIKVVHFWSDIWKTTNILISFRLKIELSKLINKYWRRLSWGPWNNLPSDILKPLRWLSYAFSLNELKS